MRLVHKATHGPVRIGDEVTVRGEPHVVLSFPPPHKASSEGRVTVRPTDEPFSARAQAEYYVSVAGLEWIEREDRGVAAAWDIDGGHNDGFGDL
jgi:hypothetical protein